MVRRLLKENTDVPASGQTITPETANANANLDAQIATLDQELGTMQTRIGELLNKKADLQKQKAANTVADTAKASANTQNTTVDNQQTSGTENGNPQQNQTQPKNINTSLDIDEDLPFLMEMNAYLNDEEEFEEPSSFEFESEETPSIDDISDSLIESSDEEEQYEDDEKIGLFYIFVDDEESDERFIGKVYKKFDQSKWREKLIIGDSMTFGTKSYMSYLTQEEVLEWIKSDYNDNVILFEEEDLDIFIEDNFDNEEYEQDEEE